MGVDTYGQAFAFFRPDVSPLMTIGGVAFDRVLETYPPHGLRPGYTEIPGLSPAAEGREQPDVKGRFMGSQFDSPLGALLPPCAPHICAYRAYGLAHRAPMPCAFRS
jgi:hypothetical protein